MRYRRLLSMLAFGAMALVGCRDEPTQPSSVAEPAPGVPELAVAHNTWTTRRDMPFERWDLAVAEVPNAAGQSILYAIGGRTSDGAPLGRVQAYNVATNTWTWKASLPRPLTSTNGAAVINGKVYVSGGLFDKRWYAEGVSSALYMYDPGTNAWVQKRAMPDGGAWGVSGVIRGKLYVVTLCVEEPYEGAMEYDTCEQSKLFRYNPATDRWATLPGPKRAYQGVGGVLYDKLYVMDVAGMEAYDPATNQWATNRPPPQRFGAAAAALGAKLYLAGGYYNNPLRTVSVYHPLTDTWTTAAPLPTARWDIAATRVFVNGQARLEVVGGSPPGNNVQYTP